MKKFNIDIFFNILAKVEYKSLVKQRPILKSPETLFSFALAKGYGFQGKGLWYDFLDEDEHLYNIGKKFKNIDKHLIYKPLVKIKGGEEDWNAFFEIGILSSKKNDFSFMIYNHFNSSYTERPKVIKIYKNNKVPTFPELKKYVMTIIKKVNFGPTRIKISNLGVWKKNIFINKSD